MRVLAVLAIVAGCTSPRLSEQGRAEAITWRGTFAMMDPPPAVQWVAAWEVTPGADGQTILGTGVKVACGVDCSTPIRVTSYAHELMHWKCYLETGDVDAAHAHCDWGLVERAQAAMAAAGMD